jgi:serine/threonine protein kinase
MWHRRRRKRRSKKTSAARDGVCHDTPLQGEKLSWYLARCRRLHVQLDVEQALDIAIDIAKTLAARHDLGEVHGRLEPKLVSFKGGRAMVTGWGIAAEFEKLQTEDSVYIGDALLGNPQYMSPERIKDPWSVQPGSDQYSLACILYELLAGEPPFTGRSLQAVLAMQVAQRPPLVRVVRLDVNESVEKVVLKALEKKPENRFASVLRFAEALEVETLGIRQV